MELIFCLLILMLKTRHLSGFSHTEFSGCRSVFFLCSDPRVEVVINGYRTGLVGSGMLHFEASVAELLVEYQVDGLSFFRESVTLTAPRTLVRGQITPVINLLA